MMCDVTADAARSPFALLRPTPLVLYFGPAHPESPKEFIVSHLRPRSGLGALLVSLCLVAFGVFLTAASVPAGSPNETGMAPDRLARIHDVVQRYIDRGQISGAVTLVARRGRIAYFEPHG